MNSKSMTIENKILILLGIVVALFTLLGYKVSDSYFTANGVVGLAILFSGFTGMCFIGRMMSKFSNKSEKSCPYHWTPEWSFGSLNSWRKNRVLIGGAVFALTILGLYVSHVFFILTGILGATVAGVAFMRCSQCSQEGCKTCEM
ncbi:MAG: hypothetical protein K0R73_712 [Candidatus Midichloriaceae bacterium]|nr:hypothetical protein [Candidatus Midichloriaceae bacterium]